MARAARAAGKNVRRGVLGWAQLGLAVLPQISLFFILAICLFGVHRLLAGELPTGALRSVYLLLAVALLILQERLLPYLYFRNILVAQQDRSAITMTIDPSGTTIEDAASTTRLSWVGVDKVVRIKRGFAILAGGTGYYAPNDALPEGMGVNEVLARVEDWRKADRVFG